MHFLKLCLAVASATHVYGLIQDVPSLNGPVMMVPDTPGSKNRTNQFQHPGLWHSHDQLELMRTNVLNGVEPWASAYTRFAQDPYSNASYEMQGPYPVISRGQISNYTSFHDDSRAAYQNAIMWYITRNESHWNRSTTILDAWGSDLENIIGTDRSLLIGIEGSIFANAAEIMRWEGGWVEQGATYKGGSGFSVQLYWLFARQSIIIGQANYGMASIMGLLNFAVYLDDVALYNYALYAYKYDRCAGVPYNYLASTGQNSEAGRDQSHVQDALQWTALAARVVANQDYDLFPLEDNLIFTAAEYAGKYLMNQTVPYDASFYRCEVVLVDGPWANISAVNRYIGYQDGKTNPAAWGLLYYEALERGVDVPWTSRVKDVYDASVKSQASPVDPFSWADLLFAVAEN
ncbi:chondroitin AC/alginate lyase [Aspergillus costaricaensis CBS 115574]|uniref:Chondroitin AC/alginate lyase n=1 Tax=Aspergillus costaricaensis CBS 115574 TaxID=1448317 RepID=A0ACD1IT22_9EURO|nr:chondroitin AC/alginate lyase [Aspergillus costaricaensis CBS 115574]RAK93788.1 chondroitin AC/alginate lyase [Aspergillus costaricaensis CBS 115574]